MLRRLTPGIALASMAALVLVGCTPEEPDAPDVAAEVEAAVQGFFNVVEEQQRSSTASADELRAYATASLAQTWARDIQAVLNDGVSSEGASVVVNVVVLGEGTDGVTARVCTDQSDVETTLADGRTIEPQDLIAWDVRLVPDSGSSPLLVDALNPTADASACDF